MQNFLIADSVGEAISKIFAFGSTWRPVMWGVGFVVMLLFYVGMSIAISEIRRVTSTCQAILYGVIPVLLLSTIPGTGAKVATAFAQPANEPNFEIDYATESPDTVPGKTEVNLRIYVGGKRYTPSNSPIVQDLKKANDRLLIPLNFLPQLPEEINRDEPPTSSRSTAGAAGESIRQETSPDRILCISNA